MSLKTFFDRAAQKMSEAVSSAPKTVDGEFEAKKAMFKQFEKEFGSLFRRVQQYFKDMQVNIKNWERIAETTKLLYPADQEYAAIESIGHVTSEAQKSYEAAWNQMREMMIKYESSIKNMGRKITDRDNARVDFDRARAKAEKSNNDPVLEATARASEQVYTEKNFAATESLDYFLETRLENLSAIMSFFARATCAMYSSCASFGEIEVVVAPAPELALAAGVSLTSAPSARTPSLAKSPRLERGSAAAASPVKSPRTASLAASEGVATRERSASAGGQPGRPVKQVAATAVLEKPPAKALPALEKKAPAAPAKRKVTMMYDFEPAADDAEGLGAREGETLIVNEESEDGEWLMCVNGNGESGYVPKNYTQPSYRPD